MVNRAPLFLHTVVQTGWPGSYADFLRAEISVDILCQLQSSYPWQRSLSNRDHQSNVVK